MKYLIFILFFIGCSKSEQPTHQYKYDSTLKVQGSNFYLPDIVDNDMYYLDFYQDSTIYIYSDNIHYTTKIQQSEDIDKGVIFLNSLSLGGYVSQGLFIVEKYDTILFIRKPFSEPILFNHTFKHI